MEKSQAPICQHYRFVIGRERPPSAVDDDRRRRIEQSAIHDAFLQFLVVARFTAARTTSAYSARMISRVLGIETGTADVAEFIRRLVFSTLTGNGDIHLKIWSLVYSDRRTLCGDFQPEGTLCSCPG